MENRQDITLGSLIDPANSTDWYSPISRVDYMSVPILYTMRQWRATKREMPTDVICAPLKQFRDVEFLDIQVPLTKQIRDLVMAVRRLGDRLVFDTIAVLDARGFLLAGEYMREGYPCVMIRKQGKLPGEEFTVKYKKEYGPPTTVPDVFCASKEAFGNDARVLVIDDLCGTGGSFQAAEKLINMSGGRVVAFICPYVIAKSDGELLCDKEILPRLRYLNTQIEASTGMVKKLPDMDVMFADKCECLYTQCTCDEYSINYAHLISTNDFVCITPPSMYSLTAHLVNVPIKWGRFNRSSNLWADFSLVKGREVHVYLDPSNSREMFDVLQILKILYKKDPKRVIVVIPFLEQGTQDRIEYSKRFESIAAVDTLSKMIGDHTIYTFDLHGPGSDLVFHDLRFTSIILSLWYDYLSEYNDVIPVFPDAGAEKRFSKLLNTNNHIEFRKKRLDTDREARIIATDDKIDEGKRYVIIDDLVRTGGTMRKVAEYILDRGGLAVDALFAHAPLEPNAAHNLSIFDNVRTSNSCPRSVPPKWVYFVVGRDYSRTH
jgi:adenine phosphoribosyltransferase